MRTAEIRREAELDTFTVMPNHLHAIVIILEDDSPCVGAHGRAPLRRKPRTLGSLVAGFKSAVTKRINEFRNTPRAVVWQRNYYEHVIRDGDSLNKIREYIVNNPAQWSFDWENPALDKKQRNRCHFER